MMQDKRLSEFREIEVRQFRKMSKAFCQMRTRFLVISYQLTVQIERRRSELTLFPAKRQILAKIAK